MATMISKEKLEEVAEKIDELFELWRDGYDDDIAVVDVKDMFEEVLDGDLDDDNGILHALLGWIQGAAYMAEVTTHELVKQAGFEVTK